MYKFRTWAKTPPKGWNSWDSYGASVTEKEVRQHAEYMEKYLKDYGWEFVVVDIQWYEPTADSSIYHAYADLEMDEFSRLRPAANRFPSSEEDRCFKPLGDYIHSLGLKFGIHIMRGIPRQAVHKNTAIKGTDLRARDIVQPNSICPWNTDMYGVDTTKPGAKEYYQSLIELYTEWGVDFIKVDDIADSKLYGAHLAEIALLREVIDESGREIVLSLSPGPASLEHGAYLEKHANMWRLTDDYWDNWAQLRDMFDRCQKWASFVGEGTWPDCDMLPMGHLGIRSVDGGGSDRLTRFTKDEQETMMTLWSLFRSPLFFGGELTDLDEWTLHLLQNERLIEIHSNGRNPEEVYRDSEFIVWKTETDSNRWLAVFNVSDEKAESERISEKLANIVSISKHDITVSKDTPAKDGSNTIPAHGVVLFNY
ncbi:Alpha galactosidase A [Alkalibacterium putridalgicola]|uniref:Alpha-galactosidase n=1 Tax=Alkalibacterium putridalgicola TaxID=426703 RepID=A0A1H7RCP5_9LACT|nr:glycoside hydrolase family 27 protein [Alkalibacterium putridalgicola]GEK88822.1 alpha-galactosidase [Alkalibacterium putridalgicola]SEL57674.1 Alpha galactosidase A [Alkalibacterium putridalgicola]